MHEIEWTQREISQALVVRPSGMLTTATYRGFTDALVKYTIDEPRAVLVELDDLRIAAEPLLAAFVSAWMRVSQWPSVPILLVAAHAPLQRWLVASAVSRFVPVHTSVTAALAAADVPPPRRCARTTVAPAGDCGQRARRFVGDICDCWQLPALCIAQVRLVTTELVENAFLHARGNEEIGLRLELWKNRLTVAVSDSDPREAVLREPRPGAHRSYGLYVVARASCAWGCAPRWPDGKVVWATLPTESATLAGWRSSR
ncbi:ATP-binding protein [Nocardia sp. CDC159]|uniref:ATP-binding protein n=1 Tax=Nocardia pulmonis TaxID=2951408 RepID=A0A9X2J305_9NOCA|nr:MULTISPECIES: ATP-binding protein [Nocardia]MCM6778586.1 ATP-binding protein [Nocardia pulmonis]MCM6791475.1 ATP-binding protein [Nocardia sp. CDC159]